MIIDAILDRKCGVQYSAYKFYDYVRSFESMKIGVDNFDITYSMDFLENIDVQNALCKYIDDNDYNPAIKDYVMSVDWINND